MEKRPMIERRSDAHIANGGPNSLIGDAKMSLGGRDYNVQWHFSASSPTHALNSSELGANLKSAIQKCIVSHIQLMAAKARQAAIQDAFQEALDEVLLMMENGVGAGLEQQKRINQAIEDYNPKLKVKWKQDTNTTLYHPSSINALGLLNQDDLPERLIVRANDG